MKGRLLEISPDKKQGKVATGNDELGVLTVYFNRITEMIAVGNTIEFEVVTSRFGNKYAKFQSIVDRNTTIFNTEDRDLWYTWGENEEVDFVSNVVPNLRLDIRVNPEKRRRKWAIDLYDYTNNRPADLKTQNTPFFTAGKYKYHGVPYDPSYTVTFNKKDYENYAVNYPTCDIYFWVNWEQTTYRNIVVLEVQGVWRARFERMAEKILAYEVALHAYQNRVDDDHNAKESYLFDLQDSTVFEKLL